MDDDLVRMDLEHGTSDEEVTDHEMGSQVWSAIKSEPDAGFMEDYGLIQEITSASGDNTVLPIDCYRQYYWSNSRLYESEIIRNSMARDRYELFLKFWYFSDNHKCRSNQNRLIKLKSLLDLLKARFSSVYSCCSYYKSMKI